MQVRVSVGPFSGCVILIITKESLLGALHCGVDLVDLAFVLLFPAE